MQFLSSLTTIHLWSKQETTTSTNNESRFSYLNLKQAFNGLYEQLPTWLKVNSSFTNIYEAYQNTKSAFDGTSLDRCEAVLRDPAYPERILPHAKLKTLAPTDVVLLAKPKHITRVLKSDRTKKDAEFGPTLSIEGILSVFNCPMDLHRELHAHVATYFKGVENYSESVGLACKQFIQEKMTQPYMEKSIKCYRISNDLKSFVTYTMGKQVFGLKNEDFSNQELENMADAIVNIIKLRSIFGFVSYVRNLIGYSSLNKIKTKMKAAIEKLATGERIEELLNAEKMGEKVKMTLIEAIGKSQMTKNGHIDYEQICNILITFFFAGQETTTSVLLSAIHHLGINTEWQQKIFDEYQAWRRDHEGDDLINFIKDSKVSKNLDYVFKEIMRLSPPIAQGRKARRDVLLEDGFIIRAGSTVGLMHGFSQINGEIWQDPKVFDPERHFDGQTNQKMDPFAQKSVNGCVGEKLATIMIKEFLMHVILEYKWTSQPIELERSMGITVEITSPIDIQLEKRETLLAA